MRYIICMPHIAVLTRQPDSHACQRLVAAAAALGVDLSLVDPHSYYLYLLPPAPTAFLNGRELALRELRLIPRLGSLATEHALAALAHLELGGARTLNPAAGLLQLRHKFTELGALAAAGLPVPDSAMLRSPAAVEPAAARLGGFPLVAKFIRGSQGLGVILAPDADVLRAVLEALNLVQYDVLLQRFYPAGAARDTRVLVLGGRARWAVERRSAPGSFRSNFHRGGSAAAVELTAPLAELAERAAGVFGLGLAGVDIIEGGSGPLVMEVNGSPGFETIEAAHGVDVAAAIVRHVLELG